MEHWCAMLELQIPIPGTFSTMLIPAASLAVTLMALGTVRYES